MSLTSTSHSSSINIPLSVLDLAPIVEGSDPHETFKKSMELAQQVDRLNYHRYWLAEHHSMPGIASAATSVLIGYIAGGTKRIRVGSGGVMLPNHAPLVIAEQFGTLESLYPGRIDLGLGRAPGSDQQTARALRRDLSMTGEEFPQQLAELRSYFAPYDPSAPKRVRAVPGEGLNIPIWLLGSSGFSAQLAGQLGLPFAFASHFSPENTMPALDLYRRSFQPSEVLQEPYAMVCVNIVAADSDEEAEYLATSGKQMILDMIRGKTPGKMKPPVNNMDALWSDYERMVVERQSSTAITGSQETVKEKLQSFIEKTEVNEVMVTCQVYDQQARLRSYELIAELMAR